MTDWLTNRLINSLATTITCDYSAAGERLSVVVIITWEFYLTEIALILVHRTVKMSNAGRKMPHVEWVITEMSTDDARRRTEASFETVSVAVRINKRKKLVCFARCYSDRSCVCVYTDRARKSHIRRVQTKSGLSVIKT